MGIHILRLPQVKKVTGLSRSSIYSLAAAGNFPKPCKLSERSSGWVESEIEDWLEDRIKAREAER